MAPQFPAHLEAVRAQLERGIVYGLLAEVEAPAINCVFHPLCAFTVDDSASFIPLPYLVAPNTAPTSCTCRTSPTRPT